MRNTERARVVSVGREWLRTPYVHQHREKGIGADCAGLIHGVGHEAAVLSITPERLAPFLKYSTTPNPHFLGRYLSTFFVPSPVPRSELAPDGSIAWMGWRRHLPMHLAIIATAFGRRTIIHSCGPFGMCVEHTLDEQWRSKVQSWWDYPGAE